MGVSYYDKAGAGFGTLTGNWSDAAWNADDPTGAAPPAAWKGAAEIAAFGSSTASSTAGTVTLTAVASAAGITTYLPAPAMQVIAGTFALTLNGTVNTQVAGSILQINAPVAGVVAKDGAGELRLTNAANSFTSLTVNTGTVSFTAGVGATGNSPLGAGPINLLSTLSYLSATAGTVARAVTLKGSAPSLASNGTGAVTFSSLTASQALTLTLTGTGSGTVPVIGDSAGGGVVALTKSGTGTWKFAVVPTYTGATTVNDGTLDLNGVAFTPTGAVTLNGGALANGTLNAAVTLAGGKLTATLTGNKTLTVSGVSAESEIANVAATFSGPVNILSGGTLKVTAGGSSAPVLGTGTTTIAGSLKVLSGSATLRGQAAYGGTLNFSGGSSFYVGG